MPDDVAYHLNKRPEKTYVTKRIPGEMKDGSEGRGIRIASKVFDTPENHAFSVERGQVVIRVTPGGREEVVAKFYEDDRSIFQLVIQRFKRINLKPAKESFSFRGPEINRLLEFLVNLGRMDLSDPGSVNLTDQQLLQKIITSQDQLRRLVSQNQEIFLTVARTEITESDVIALGYRKKQLSIFETLLANSATTEANWQNFFEANKWVFGYGLTYIWTSAIGDKKLEQIVAGNDLWQRGKRADGVLKTKGAVEALCFVEIKKHSTQLLKNQYRPSCWSPSDELIGGVIQSQATVEAALRHVRDRFRPQSETGDPTGEEFFAFEPRSFLVIGSLTEFHTGLGINIDKYRSFELFRRNTTRPEIITFDELFERAAAIVRHEEAPMT